jgi:nicotinamide-nucleotide amidase
MTDSELMQLSEQVGLALKARGATVTTAESCTGGWVAKVLTDIAGSSAWFERGFVTYSNEAKSQMIGVSEATLLGHGAVSEPVVVEMAVGALRAARATMPFRLAASPGRMAAATKTGRHGVVWRRQRERAGRDPAGMLCRRPRSGASSGNGLCAKSPLATISTKYLILYDYTV